MVDYDRLSIYKHSIVSQFEMPAYLPSSTLLLSHSLDIQFTLDLIYSQDMTLEYSIRRAETSLHSKRHSVSCVIHVFLKDSPIQLPNSKIARHSSSKTRFDTIPENPGIRRFIWEHANDINRILHRLAQAGATISPKKSQVARPEITIVGQKLTYDGRLPDTSRISKILKWPIPRNKTEVRGFLGLCGTVRIWIKDYSLKARPLTELTRNQVTFEWTTRRQNAFNVLKEAMSSPPVLRP